MIKEQNIIRVKLTSYGSLQTLCVPVKLYKDSYNIVELQCLVPKVVDSNLIVVKVYASTRDVSGELVWSSQTYNLVYRKDVNINNQLYELYSAPLPEEFCENSGDITITFAQGTVDSSGEVLSVLTSGDLNLFIRGEGFNLNGVKLSNYDVTAANVNKLLKGLIEAKALSPYDNTYTYSLGALAYGEVDGEIALYKSLIADNLDKPLTDETSWMIVGISGTKGDSTFIRYSKNADGKEMSDVWQDGYDYIGLYNGRSASDNYLDYTWSRFVGKQGPQGEMGPQGDPCVLTDDEKSQIAQDAAEMVSFVQPNQPASAVEGSLWIDTDEESESVTQILIHSISDNSISVADDQLTYSRGVVEVRKIGSILWIIDNGVYNLNDNFKTKSSRTVLEFQLPKEISNCIHNVNGAYGSTGTICYFPALAYENLTYSTFNCQSYLKRSAIGEDYDTYQVVYTGLGAISGGGLCGFHLKMPVIMVKQEGGDI